VLYIVFGLLVIKEERVDNIEEVGIITVEFSEIIEEKVDKVEKGVKIDVDFSEIMEEEG
jgi:hypothetical protein